MMSLGSWSPQICHSTCPVPWTAARNHRPSVSHN